MSDECESYISMAFQISAQSEHIEALEAENARLREPTYTALNPDELQPCGHPVQAIRSSPYIGEQHSNWCGWCEEVGQLQAEVARLREALLKVWNFSARYAQDESGKRIMYCPLCKLRVGHEEDCPFAALSDKEADDG